MTAQITVAKSWQECPRFPVSGQSGGSPVTPDPSSAAQHRLLNELEKSPAGCRSYSGAAHGTAAPHPTARVSGRSAPFPQVLTWVSLRLANRENHQYSCCSIPESRRSSPSIPKHPVLTVRHPVPSKC